MFGGEDAGSSVVRVLPCLCKTLDSVPSTIQNTGLTVCKVPLRWRLKDKKFRVIFKYIASLKPPGLHKNMVGTQTTATV